MSKRKAGFRKISEQSVREKTGRGWEEWFTLLDEFCLTEKGHTLAARHLQQHYGVSPWWAQAVTIRYEWERGLKR